MVAVLYEWRRTTEGRALFWGITRRGEALFWGITRVRGQSARGCCNPFRLTRKGCNYEVTHEALLTSP